MKIIESVAAVFCHAGRFFLVRRQPHLQDFPGYDSFPGGKIDREDSTSAHPARLLQQWEGQKMHALVREIREELGYDLPGAIAAGQITSIRLLATALAPALVPVRFRLHFFRIDLKTLPVFAPDPGEIADSFWETPRQALDRFHQGEALMVPPLRWVLEELDRAPQGCSFGDLSPQFNEDLYVPRMEPVSGLCILPVPCNSLPPSDRTNAFILGDAHAPQILVDPSPKSADVLEKLHRTLSGDSISALFLTHHHSDHHEQAPELARRLKVPVWMSADCLSRITSKHGSDYFSGLKVEIRQDGDILTQWKGEAVRVHAIPGHDAGQLALAPESLRWFIVGDLIQRLGTVVIAAPEGDMATYFQTLERIIELDPAIIVPSHGMPMRSSYRLQATLEHRRAREEAILALHAGGKTADEILGSLYQGIDPQLRPSALENIRSHLRKLSQDGRL